MTSARNEPATFQFVAPHLTHCATGNSHQSLLLNINPYINLRNLTISVIYVYLFLQITQHCPCGYKTQQQNNGVACLIFVLDNILCGPHKWNALLRITTYYSMLNCKLNCFIRFKLEIIFSNKHFITLSCVERQKEAHSAALWCQYSPIGTAHAR